jgi:uncharacterized membrane protein YeaQ/YmgE (transglycosylase-associated protein family)
MNIIIGLIAGVVIGWLLSVRMRTDRDGLIRNVVAGVAGAYTGSWILGKLLEPAGQGSFSAAAMIASLVGATALVLVVSRLSAT